MYFKSWFNHRIGSLKLAVLGAVLGTMSMHATAEMLAIKNPSFEIPTLQGNGFTDNLIPGWVGLDDSAPRNFGVYDPIASFLFPSGFIRESLGTLFDPQGDLLGQAPHGSNIAYIEQGGIVQQLTATLMANTRYRLTAHIGNSLNDPFQGYELQLLADGEVLSGLRAASSGEGRFVRVDLIYRSQPGSPLLGKSLGIRIIKFGDKASSEVYVDHIQLEAVPFQPVP